METAKTHKQSTKRYATRIRVRLKYWRLVKGMTMMQLVAASGVGLQVIYHIEKKQHIPRGETLNKLANGLGIRTEDLIVEEVHEVEDTPIVAKTG